DLSRWSDKDYTATAPCLSARQVWFFPAVGKELDQPPAMRRTDIHSSYRYSTNIIDADTSFFFFEKKNHLPAVGRKKHFLFMALALALRSGKNDIAPTFLCHSAF